MTGGLSIIGWGAITPIGPTARHTGFYLRAGRSSFAGSAFVDKLGEAVVLSSVSILPKDLVGPGRIVALAAQALEGGLRALVGSLGASRLRVCLALPARYRGASKVAPLTREGVEVVARISAHELLGISPSEVHVFPEGVAAGASALAHARKLLDASPGDVAVVLGADSYYDASVLAQLEQEDRLMTPENLDSLRPGEAAACLVLAGARHALARSHAASLLLSVGVGQEPTAQDSEQHSMARGLTEALKTAVADLRATGTRSNWFWTDVTHEQGRVRELQILFARFGDVMGFDLRLETPARELGEVGAATLPLFAVLATEAWYREYAADPYAVFFARSQHGLCGALCMQQAARNERRS